MGSSGTGTLNVTDGGVVATTYGYIGSQSGSTGEATVTGAVSQWNNSDDLYVGREGIGTLKVKTSGTVSNTDGYISYGSDSVGVATVTGVGSKWTNSGSLYIGGNSSEAGGRGTMNINDSALVTVSDTTKLWDEGIINLDGGTLDTGTLDLTTGTFNMTGGLLRADSVSGDIDVPRGIVAPGHSPGVLAINGDYAQGAAATLEIELGGLIVGTQYDQVNIAGTANLDGTGDPCN